ncbi:MAG TPA: SpoIIE family protein phosphatase [Geobacteraceae bacterium]
MNVNLPLADVILDSLNEGLYVCDRNRRILYWSKSAERITGWAADDVVGHRCLDDILCHQDKDGHPLCSTEFCPLHRSMVTDKASTVPIIVFGKGKSGKRIPMIVSVAPLHERGEVVGGVETFYDYTEAYANLERAKRIQMLSMTHDLPHDDRVKFATFYLPYDMIGGDFVAVQQLGTDHYGFFLADVMGRGVAAALHTMHLSSLWSRYCQALVRPARFARLLNRELCRVVRDESFATAVCGILDARHKSVKIASAGGPPFVLVRPDGRAEQWTVSGVPFGMIEDTEYEEAEFLCSSGDCLLMFTDGAIEIQNADGQMLGAQGLIDILTSFGHPAKNIETESLQQALLNFSNKIRLDDDLTLLEARFF